MSANGKLPEAIVFFDYGDVLLVGPIAARWPIGYRVVIPAGGARHKPESDHRAMPQEAEIIGRMPDGVMRARVI